ncbi:hypothetical protein PMAYCL1PPCAC_24813, partial [Pristionchus mayeri]
RKRHDEVIFIISEHLLDSVFHVDLHEIWTVVAGSEELERRRKRREEDPSANSARLAVAHVVLSTDSDRDETRRQLRKAVHL